MVASFSYYLFTLLASWYVGLFGGPEEFWTSVGLPRQPIGPPAWSMYAGIALTALTLWGLGSAYLASEKIIRSGCNNSFAELSMNLKQLSLGLVVFWFGYNCITGLMPILVCFNLPADQKPEFQWDPLDIDIIFLVLATAIYAIAESLLRASAIENENKQFF